MAYRILLDIDGVLYQFSKTGQYMIAKRDGFRYREELDWDESRWDCNRPQSDWDWLLSGPQADKVFRHGHLYRGAIEFVEELDKIGDVVIVTKRPKAGVQATLDFFSFEKLPIAGFHILGLEERKSDVPGDVLIDDSIDNMEDMLWSTKSDLILMDRPWNQGWFCSFGKHENYRHFHRATDFDDALERVREWASLKSKTVESEPPILQGWSEMSGWKK